MVKDLERKVASFSHKPPKSETSEESKPSYFLSIDRKAEILQELRLKIRRQTEARKLKREELRDQLLQNKRVLDRQQQVLQLKERLLEERKMSPAQRQFQWSNAPRFHNNEDRRPSKRHLASLPTPPSYDSMLAREKHTLHRLQSKILQLTTTLRTLRHSKPTKSHVLLPK